MSNYYPAEHTIGGYIEEPDDEPDDPPEEDFEAAAERRQELQDARDQEEFDA